MTTAIGGDNLNMIDQARRLDPDGTTADIIELVAKKNPMIYHAPAFECNDGKSHSTTIRTGLPQGTWRRMYGGVGSDKSTTAQAEDSCGMLDSMPFVDKKLVKMQKDPNKFRLSESVPFFEGLGQQVAQTSIYGDTDTHEERFMGLAPRLGETDNGDWDHSSRNVLDAGGVGAFNTSIMLIGWGEQTCHYLFPEGSKAGLTHEDMGTQLVPADDGSGNLKVLMDSYEWDIGLTLRDWRACGRIANIDINNLVSETGAADLLKLMITLAERVEGGMQRWYMHPKVRTAFRLQLLDKANAYFTWENIEGEMVLHFDGKPVHPSEALLLTEAVVPEAA